MKGYTTLEVVQKIMENKSLRFTTEIDGKVKTAFYNQNGGISADKNTTLVMGGKILNALWQEEQIKFTFMEAVNSKKWIKHKAWKEFKPIQESLYDLLDYPINEVVQLINGDWNIDKDSID